MIQYIKKKTCTKKIPGPDGSLGEFYHIFEELKLISFITKLTEWRGETHTIIWTDAEKYLTKVNTFHDKSVKVLVVQLCLTLWNPMGCSLPGSFTWNSLHGILQARILEWVVIPFSMGSSQSRDQTHISCIAGRFFTVWATKEALSW